MLQVVESIVKAAYLLWSSTKWLSGCWCYSLTKLIWQVADMSDETWTNMMRKVANALTEQSIVDWASIVIKQRDHLGKYHEWRQYHADRDHNEEKNEMMFDANTMPIDKCVYRFQCWISIYNIDLTSSSLMFPLKNFMSTDHHLNIVHLRSISLNRWRNQCVIESIDCWTVHFQVIVWIDTHFDQCSLSVSLSLVLIVFILNDVYGKKAKQRWMSRVHSLIHCCFCRSATHHTIFSIHT